MTSPAKPTHSDDLVTMVRILSDSPADGLSLDEIYALKQKSNDPWSYRTINNLLCDLGSRVLCQKIRVKHSKVAKYSLKETR